MHTPGHECPPACMPPPGTHARQILRDAINEREVRILLECILVVTGVQCKPNVPFTVKEPHTSERIDIIADVGVNWSYMYLSLLYPGNLAKQYRLHLNHLIASRMTNYDWPFGTLPFGLFWSNLDTRDLETYPRTYSGHFLNMSLFDNSRAV